MLENNRQKGARGEAAAADFLKSKQYKILNMNFRGTYGEIDIIAEVEAKIVFVEVKTRSSIKNGRPAEAVNNRKQQRIIGVAEEYIALSDLSNYDFRFDVIEIMDKAGKLYYNHIENAFWA